MIRFVAKLFNVETCQGKGLRASNPRRVGRWGMQGGERKSPLCPMGSKGERNSLLVMGVSGELERSARPACIGALCQCRQDGDATATRCNGAARLDAGLRHKQGVSNRGRHAPFGKMVLDVVQNTSCGWRESEDSARSTNAAKRRCAVLCRAG